MQFRSYRVGVDCFNDCKRVIEVFSLKSLLQSIAATRVQSVEALKLKGTLQTLFKFSHEKMAFVEQPMSCLWRLNIIIFIVGYYFEFLTSFCMHMLCMKSVISLFFHQIALKIHQLLDIACCAFIYGPSMIE